MPRSGLDGVETQGNRRCRRVHTTKWLRCHICSPLCEKGQIPRVVKAYLKELDRLSLKPVWCCVDREIESYLAEELGWSALIVPAEERLDPTEVDPDHKDKTMRKKIHRAEREGVKVHDIGGVPSAELQSRIGQRCQEWSADRKEHTFTPPTTMVRYVLLNCAIIREECASGGDGYFDVDLRSGCSSSDCSSPRFPGQVGTRFPWCASRHYRVHPLVSH